MRDLEWSRAEKTVAPSQSRRESCSMASSPGVRAVIGTTWTLPPSGGDLPRVDRL